MNNISISDNDPDGALSREYSIASNNDDHTRSFMEEPTDSAYGGIGLTIPSLVKQAKSCKPMREDFLVKSANGKDDLSEIPKQQQQDIPDFASNTDGYLVFTEDGSDLNRESDFSMHKRFDKVAPLLDKSKDERRMRRRTD